VPPFAATNVTKTPLGGRPVAAAGGRDLRPVIVDNQTAPDIPTGGTMEALA
jgi:branched-chain amino acid transport system substrate-binding protein